LHIWTSAYTISVYCTFGRLRTQSQFIAHLDVCVHNLSLLHIWTSAYTISVYCTFGRLRTQSQFIEMTEYLRLLRTKRRITYEYIKGTPRRSGRVTQLKRFFSKTYIFLLLKY